MHLQLILGECTFAALEILKSSLSDLEIIENFPKEAMKVGNYQILSKWSSNILILGLACKR